MGPLLPGKSRSVKYYYHFSDMFQKAAAFQVGPRTLVISGYQL